MSSYQEVDVVIIGAGFAGLAAAFELKKQNISFVVLEARKRPGGRVYSIKTDDGVTIDLGAQWIEEGHHRLKRLLSLFKLKTVSTYKKGKAIYNINGKKTVSKKPPLSASGFLDIFQTTRKLNKISKQIDLNSPWCSLEAKKYDGQTMEQFLKESMYTSRGYSYYKFLLEEMLCTNLHEVSALDVLWCIKSAGTVQNFRNAEATWIKEGVGTLALKMANALGSKVLYDHPVTGITYGKNSATIDTKKGVGWNAKRVILTAPPNLQIKIHFDPPLPSMRAQLLEHSGMPSVTKIILVYEEPFWRKKGLSGVIQSDTGVVRETVDSSPLDGKRGVLTVLVTGNTARTLKVPSEEIPQALVPLLGEEAASPLQVYFENWSEQQWSRGGYGVHYAPGVITNYGSALIKPIDCLHFAGTETATEWRLFMEGALQSGERAAKEVVAFLGRNSK